MTTTIRQFDPRWAANADTLRRARSLAPPMPVAIQLAHAGRKASSRVPWEGGSLITLDEGGSVDRGDEANAFVVMAAELDAEGG